MWTGTRRLVPSVYPTVGILDRVAIHALKGTGAVLLAATAA